MKRENASALLDFFHESLPTTDLEPPSEVTLDLGCAPDAEREHTTQPDTALPAHVRVGGSAACILWNGGDKRRC